MITVKKLSADDWAGFSEAAHKICFSEQKPKEWDRIDFALLGVNSDDVPLGYVTCREMDANAVYWQFGGAFPSSRGTINSFACYAEFFRFCQLRYKRIATYIENTNQAMLKMAMKIGFLITGIRNFDGEILLELTADLR